MDANIRKYRTDIAADLHQRAPAYSMFYAMYLAERVMYDQDRAEEIFEQPGLRLRPNETYAYPKTTLESINVSYSHEVNEETLQKAAGLHSEGLLSAEAIQEIEHIKGQPTLMETDFKALVASLLTEDECLLFEEELLATVRHPNFSFVVNLPLGLYGADAPLPRCYHQEVAYQQAERAIGKVPLQNFLDMFNNRIYWLYYQAWKKYRTHLQLDARVANKTRRHLLAFTGIPVDIGHFADGTSWGVETPAVMQLANQAHYRMIGLAGIFGRRVRNRIGLLAILHTFFPGVSFDLSEFVPNRQKLDDVPAVGKGIGATMKLGCGGNSILGKSVMDYTSKVCLITGPLSLDEYLEFLPDGKHFPLLDALLKLYLPDDMTFSLTYKIRTETLAKFPLSDQRVRMGQSFWIGKPTEKIVDVPLAASALQHAN